MTTAVPRPVALLIVAAVLFAGLGSPAGGTHPDEGLYLQAAREMHDRGDWLTPTVDGRPDFTKPPLLYWAMGASFALFGETLWAARLPVALAALVLVFVTGRLARRTSGPSAEPVAILVLGTCLGLLRYARVDLMDVPLALAIAVGLWACWRVADGAPMSLLLVTGLAAGAATLLKGPVGPLLLAAPAAAYLARRRLLVPALPWLAAAVVLALVLAAPWYLAMAHRHGEPFVVRFFGTENVGKFRFPWTVEGELGLLLALPVLLLPWTPLVRVRGPGAALAWPWVAGLLILYSLPGLKHPHYVVPALAPLAVLASGDRPRTGRLASAALILALGMAGALALRFPSPGVFASGSAAWWRCSRSRRWRWPAARRSRARWPSPALRCSSSRACSRGRFRRPCRPGWRSTRGRVPCSPRRRTPASTPSSWGGRCTARPERARRSVPSRRARRCW